MQWIYKPKPDHNIVKHLEAQLGVCESIAILLAQRGIKDYNQAKSFFRPSLDDLHYPFLMKDMDKAVFALISSVRDQQTIMVYGDYDVDGTTSVALMTYFLNTVSKGEIISYVPDRYKEGYGLSYQGIDIAKNQGVSLIITLDCGIKAVDQVNYAKSLGIDVIICDHHRPGDILPEALAILDPKQDNCKYPYKELCGCGVGFKLIQGVLQDDPNILENQCDDMDFLQSLLDLVAIAIAADIVPITGENRILMHYGLRQLQLNPRVGVKALLQRSKRSNIDVSDLVFGVAPRINAAGRMKHGLDAVKILLEQDVDKANNFSLEIETYNTKRKHIDREITDEALSQIVDLQQQDASTTVVFEPHWHKGVIGIVASRLIETYYRPTIVFTKNGDYLAASARSVQGYDIYNALEACSEYILQFGGHKYAAGLTLLEKNYKTFKQAFEIHVSNTLPESLKEPFISVDLCLEAKDISPKFYRILKQFGPFGPQNMNPIFQTDTFKDTGYAKQVGQDEKHLKAYLKSKDVFEQPLNSFGAIGFNLGQKIGLLTDQKPIKVLYSLEENHWNGSTTLQLHLKDITSKK